MYLYLIKKNSVQFLFFLQLLFLSTSIFAETDMEAISQGKAGQLAEEIRDEIRLTKSHGKLQDLFLIDLLRTDSDAFIKDYLEFESILFGTYKQKLISLKELENIDHSSEERIFRLSEEKSLRKLEDFTSFVVNYYTLLYSRHEHSWVPGIGIEALKENHKKIGMPDGLWTTLNLFTEAEIYYLEGKFILAEIKSHDAIAHLFLTDPHSIGGQVALTFATQYFENISANRRVSEMLAQFIADNQRSSKALDINPYSGRKILEFIHNVSIDQSLAIINNPEIINLAYPDIDINRNYWLDSADASLASKAIQIYLEDGEKIAKQYLQKNMKLKPSLLINEFISGVVYKNQDVPSMSAEKQFKEHLTELEKNGSNKYDIGYTKLYRSILRTVGFNNRGEKALANKELAIAINHLEPIANVYDHLPGTSLPTAFRVNRVLFDLFMKLLIDSELETSDKTTAIELISSLSLVSREYEYVNALDLIDNIKDDYGKTLAIEYQSFTTKRDNIYKDIFKKYLESEHGKFEAPVDDYLALLSLNERLANLLKYLNNTKLAGKLKLDSKSNLSSSDLFVNLFCLESFCYSYKKLGNQVYLNYKLRKKIYQESLAFVDAIKNGEDGKKEGKVVADFIFPSNFDFKKIKKCYFVPTSGFSALPLSLISVNESYLIDLCSISTYTSIQHFEREKVDQSTKKREKWAISIADPIIRSNDESEAIEETLSMIRGIKSLDDIAELPETAHEAQVIVGENKALSTLLLRDRAKKDFLFSENLSNYQILSFSTHGLMAGETDSNLSPAILLSPSKNGALLTTNEILELTGAPAVVILAICNASTPSANVNSIEISSIANAFLMKGSSSVVSTLWPLNSKASVQILESSFELIKRGFSLSEAIQNASISYRMSNPDSTPKDWGAFIVYGNTSGLNEGLKEPTIGDGYPIDITIAGDEIYVLAKEKANFIIDVWNKKTLKLIKNVNLSDITDAKFLSGNSTDFISLKNKVLSFNKLDNIKNTSIKICSSPVGDFWQIHSTLVHKDKIYSILNGRTDSYAGINYIDPNTCKFGNLSFDLKGEDKIYDRFSVGLINDSPASFANRKLPENENQKWENRKTDSGLVDYCSHNWQATWQKLTIDEDGVLSFDLSDNSFESSGSNSGYQLPMFSHNPQRNIILNDSCSDRSALIDYEKLFKPNKPYNLTKISGPWAIGDYFTSGSLTIQAESYFNSFVTGDYWKKLLDSQSNAYNFFVTAKVGNGPVRYLGPLNECANFVGAESDGLGYIVCGNINGYSLKSIH